MVQQKAEKNTVWQNPRKPLADNTDGHKIRERFGRLFGSGGEPLGKIDPEGNEPVGLSPDANLICINGLSGMLLSALSAGMAVGFSGGKKFALSIEDCSPAEG
ncbi:hypothetical protein GN956_G13216 [Arapaima gigas]